ncbi:MAG: hypothetical protein ACI8XX_002094 [Polaribacter sp.]|jgi:hypothetical protein
MAIGIQRKPSVNDQPNYILVDSDYQCDQDKSKGTEHTF